MADEYTPTSWVDGVPPYIDAEHLNKIEAELVRLGTQLAAIKAAYLGKSAISNVQVNDQNKVPSSALVYGMNEDISELNSNLNGIVSPQKSTDANNIPNGVSFFTYHSDTLNGPSAEKVFGGTNAGIALACKYSDVYAVEMALAAGVPNRYAGIAARAKEASGWSKWIRLLTFANIQTGVVNFATTPGEVGTFAVTFPQAFSSAPKVFVNAKTSSPGDKFVNAGSITSTGFTVYANVNSASITVDWLAAAI